MKCRVCLSDFHAAKFQHVDDHPLPSLRIDRPRELLMREIPDGPSIIKEYPITDELAGFAEHIPIVSRWPIV